jgi:hypothetical protein
LPAAFLNAFVHRTFRGLRFILQWAVRQRMLGIFMDDELEILMTSYKIEISWVDTLFGWKNPLGRAKSEYFGVVPHESRPWEDKIDVSKK